MIDTMTQIRHCCRVTTPAPLTTAQTAQRLHVAKVTIQRWIRAGRLPAHKLPGTTGSYLIAVEDVDRLAQELAA